LSFNAARVFKRSDIAFASGKNGVLCRGWFYTPEGEAGRLPAVIMAHGFGAVKELRLDAYAEKFAEAGCAVLVFDYRHFGTSEGEPRQLIDISLAARRLARRSGVCPPPFGNRCESYCTVG
jgi:fermentation-respiration switch protein FrsA (DUF1100 family)